MMGLPEYKELEAQYELEKKRAEDNVVVVSNIDSRGQWVDLNTSKESISNTPFKVFFFWILQKK
jgi:hypothetical protein